MSWHPETAEGRVDSGRGHDLDSRRQYTGTLASHTDCSPWLHAEGGQEGRLVTLLPELSNYICTYIHMWQ